MRRLLEGIGTAVKSDELLMAADELLMADDELLMASDELPMTSDELLMVLDEPGDGLRTHNTQVAVALCGGGVLRY